MLVELKLLAGDVVFVLPFSSNFVKRHSRILVEFADDRVYRRHVDVDDQVVLRNCQYKVGHCRGQRS